MAIIRLKESLYSNDSFQYVISYILRDKGPAIHVISYI